MTCIVLVRRQQKLRVSGTVTVATNVPACLVCVNW